MILWSQPELDWKAFLNPRTDPTCPMAEVHKPMAEAHKPMAEAHKPMAEVYKPRRRVLLLSPFFFPELISTGKANTHLARALAADGAEVTAICSHPLYPDWIPVPSDAMMEGIKILRGGAGMRYSRRMALRRAVLEVWFAVYAAGQCWRLRKQTEIVISVVPPSLFALCVHAWLPRRIRRIAVVHDLQGVLAGQHESALRRWITGMIRAVESRGFLGQDRCIFFSSDMAKIGQQTYGLDAAKVAVQYPCVTLELAGDDQHTATRLESMLPAGQAHVVYSGALGLKQNSETFVAWMQSAARKFPAARFHVFSGGPIFDKLRERNAGDAECRVQFHPLVEERDLAELYARSTIQLIPQAEKTEAGALPSKLPNLLAAGVYTLAITTPQSEVARLLREVGTGSIVERWEEELFLQRLGEALLQAQAISATARRLQAKTLLKRFTVENLAELVFAADAAPSGETV